MPKQRLNTIASINFSTKTSSLDLKINTQFSNIKNIKASEIIALIPPQAHKRILTPEIGGVSEGYEYKWS